MFDLFLSLYFIQGKKISSHYSLVTTLQGSQARESRRRRAYPQQIVTTRLLYYLQDPFAQQSRLQWILPRACPNYNTRITAIRFLHGGGIACWDSRPEPILIRLQRAGVSPRSGTDSDLEAFSHYLADGSVAALPCRTTAKTNYLNQRFLSY